MNEIYDGKDAILSKGSYYTVEFNCQYVMNLYPFDTTICSIDMVPDAYDGAVMDLTPENLTYLNIENAPQFTVIGTSVKKVNYTMGLVGVKVEITLQRQILSVFMTTYLPTILINVINQATNYFDADEFFEAIVTVNLTSIMVLTSLYIAVSYSLPTTSYIKMVEIWLLFTLFYPFFIVLLHTFIQSTKRRRKMIKVNLVASIQTQTTATKENEFRSIRVAIFVGKYVTPVIGLLFTLGYMSFGLYKQVYP